LSPIPQIPYEAFRILAQYTGAKLLEATGDKGNGKIARDIADEMLKGFLKTITPRVESSPQKVNARNGIFQYTGSQWTDARY
jgi:hypothetical protein